MDNSRRAGRGGHRGRGRSVGFTASSPGHPSPCGLHAAYEFRRLRDVAGALTRWPHAGFHPSEFTFGGPGQIYVKLLPDGEPVQLTHDDMFKRGSPKFSLDGARLAYAVLKVESGWDAWVVPVLGGQPRPLLTNASGLTWIESGPGPSRLLFSAAIQKV